MCLGEVLAHDQPHPETKSMALWLFSFLEKAHNAVTSGEKEIYNSIKFICSWQLSNLSHTVIQLAPLRSGGMGWVNEKGIEKRNKTTMMRSSHDVTEKTVLDAKIYLGFLKQTPAGFDV